MSRFKFHMQVINHPFHQSKCPICSDSNFQAGWVIGNNGLNLQIIKNVAIIGNELFESVFSYCSSCDFAYFFPRPSEAFINDFYLKGGGREELPSDSVLISQIQSMSSGLDVSTVFSILKSAGIDNKEFKDLRVLEIGPGTSIFAPAFKDLGMEYWANEIGIETGDFLERSFGAKLIRQPLDKIPGIYNEKFDLIFSKDSLEHHLYPLESINAIIRLLKANGLLVLSVPNLHSHSFKLTSVNHPYFAFPPHLNYFSENTFKKILENFGLENIFIKSFCFPSEIFYCMELCIKLGLVFPDEHYLREISDLGKNERLLISARKKP